MITAPESTFKVLDFTSPNVESLAAARLLRAECPVTDSFIKCAPHVEPPTGIEEHDLQSFLAAHDEFYPVYGLVDRRGSVLAAAGVNHEYYEEVPNTEIIHLAVHPNYRRQGLGTRLVRHIAEQAISHGDIYVRHGFNPDREAADAYGFAHSFPISEAYYGEWQADAATIAAIISTS
ncbi:MAG: GNAT family N-acetyltransferase [Candidatus Saccharimonadales bacterium]